MFFRREKPHQPTFDERVANLKQLGFDTQSAAGGKVLVTRKGFGAMVEHKGESNLQLGKAGLMVGNEIAELVNAVASLCRAWIGLRPA